MKIQLSNEAYHLREAIGSSLIREIHKTTVAHAVLHEFKETEDTIWGSLVHAMILEPETVAEGFKILPVVNKRTTVGKETLAAFKEKHSGAQFITEEVMEKANRMVESVMAHPIARDMLTGGESEYSYFSHEPELGLDFKCRPDYKKNGSIIDLKTSKDASYEGFAKEIGNRGYHIQAAYYIDVHNATVKGTKEKPIEDDGFYIVAVEKKEPFAVATYRLTKTDIEAGRDAYKKALKDYKAYLIDKEFEEKEKLGKAYSLSRHGYPVEVVSISVPFYMLDKIK